MKLHAGHLFVIGQYLRMPREKGESERAHSERLALHMATSSEHWTEDEQIEWLKAHGYTEVEESVPQE